MSANDFTKVPHTVGCKTSQGIVCQRWSQSDGDIFNRRAINHSNLSILEGLTTLNEMGPCKIDPKILSITFFKVHVSGVPHHLCDTRDLRDYTGWHGIGILFQWKFESEEFNSLWFVMKGTGGVGWGVVEVWVWVWGEGHSFCQSQ